MGGLGVAVLFLRELLHRLVDLAELFLRAVARICVTTLVLHTDRDAVVPFFAGRSLAAAIPGMQFVQRTGSIDRRMELSLSSPHSSIMELGTFSPQQISWLEATLRIGCAIVFPLLIGLERFLRKKPIDFRPFVIISVAACGLSLGSLELAQKTFDQQLQIDPTRVFAGVITGIGFLGAGAMFRDDQFVKGAGSAAAIWSAGAIGIICGIGSLWLAAFVAIPILLLLLISGPYVDRYSPD